ncbi:uncharacterized protein JN550_010121 [Neoarthrinium moseri]|uniref:uncharacterized protein n=1 Tax=Neoarthrinium moseri TaxID=1658444 RepID=UPI001FDC6E05|nr:uncharacterized protein JN550_010121 [Neoarthrinium moseri]KAI1862596.1 hypothetical protein JN550_010121 [Neoarthrinium moseri]
MLDADGDLRGYIAKQQASTDSLASINSSISSSSEKKPYTWRMQHPETRKYQLFPREKQLPPVTAGKQLDPEQAFALAMGQAGDKSDKTEKSSGLRLRIKEHNLIRRRKVSVPELGPMTTVQEVAMDSPTIPGRPALHERSISSPVNTLRQHNLAESMSYTQDTCNENAETKKPNAVIDPQKSRGAAPVQPMSPKSLAPLVIPIQNNSLPRLARQLSLSRLRSGSTPEPGNRSAKNDESPKMRTPFTPFTPLSSSAYTTTPKSAVTSSTLPTPISAPLESRESPRPWEKYVNSTPNATPQANNSDTMSTPKAEPEIPRSATAMSYRTESDMPIRSGTAFSHRRNQSDTGSIMERGRPRKRVDGTPVGVSLRRTGSKRSKSAERRAFEQLPQGWKPSEATSMLDQSEISYLQKQALGQATRFEVLKKDDVESLSKELRHLDERTDYLRRTYTSLRAGRRNLHSRICQYLRSPRVAKFSYDSMLKQEEALAELDASIDDWVTKLEHAENRRTRVRQKLLEHVAAAATLSIPSDIVGASESLQQAMGVRALDSHIEVSTPPRSPTKAEAQLHAQSPSPSPQRVVARVPSVIPEVPSEDTAGLDLDDKVSERQSALQRMESIRIYADSDVYALLADVESEFTKLSGAGRQTPEPVQVELPLEKRRELHRAQSHEVLNGRPVDTTKTPPVTPPAPTPPMKDAPSNEGDVFLTAAVFQPTPVSVA